MHKARAFLLVCAGLLCLALAYHLGAQSARAQAPAGLRMMGPGLVLSGGSVYQLVPGGWLAWTNLPPVSPTDMIYFSGDYAITVAGEGWYGGGSGPAGPSQWVSLGTVPGGSTPAQGISFGQLKAKYAK